MSWVRKKRQNDMFGTQRGLISDAERRKPSIRLAVTAVNAFLLLVLLISGLGPMVLLVKFSISDAQDILKAPMEWFPSGIHWENLSDAWNSAHIGNYFFNTLMVAGGSWLVQLIVAITGGYVLGILKPKYAPLLHSLIMGTMLIPSVVLLVPLYLEIVKMPVLGVSLLDTWWAVWLPAGANAFNVIMMTRFFASLPVELFEAAKVDGAGPFRMLFSLVLPMSKPIIGVISVMAFIGAWKDYLWPMLVLKTPAIQTLSVRLPGLARQSPYGVYMAGMAISTILPIIIFLIFQKTFLKSAGLSGAIKG